jgi:hypothetical protein
MGDIYRNVTDTQMNSGIIAAVIRYGHFPGTQEAKKNNSKQPILAWCLTVTLMLTTPLLSTS